MNKRRKDLLSIILGNKKKDDADFFDPQFSPTPENQDGEDVKEIDIPKEFEEIFDGFTKEQLIKELYRLETDLTMAKREIQLLAFENTSYRMKKES